MPVQELRRGYATLYAIACSPEEFTEVEQIDPSQILRLASGIQQYLEVTMRIPRVRVLCVGSRADLEQAPTGVRSWLNKPFGRGVWLRGMRTAIALFGTGRPVRMIVVHELTHALLDLLTKGFPYPIALAEGFARRAEYLLPYRNGESEWAKDSGQRAMTEQRYWDSVGLMSVRELLSFDAYMHWRRNDMRAFVVMTELSFWLNAYLFRMATKHPIAKRVLSELLSRNIRTPEGVYEWMQEVLDMRADQLEESFRCFCTTGALPE